MRRRCRTGRRRPPRRARPGSPRRISGRGADEVERALARLDPPDEADHRAAAAVARPRRRGPPAAPGRPDRRRPRRAVRRRRVGDRGRGREHDVGAAPEARHAGDMSCMWSTRRAAPAGERRQQPAADGAVEVDDVGVSGERSRRAATTPARARPRRAARPPTASARQSYPAASRGIAQRAVARGGERDLPAAFARARTAAATAWSPLRRAGRPPPPRAACASCGSGDDTRHGHGRRRASTYYERSCGSACPTGCEPDGTSTRRPRVPARSGAGGPGDARARPRLRRRRVHRAPSPQAGAEVDRRRGRRGGTGPGAPAPPGPALRARSVRRAAAVRGRLVRARVGRRGDRARRRHGTVAVGGAAGARARRPAAA